MPGSPLVLGLRLHLMCTLRGLPRTFALAGARAADTRCLLLDLVAVEPQLLATRPGPVLPTDKNYYDHELERILAELGVRLHRPARKGEAEPPGGRLSKPLLPFVESSTIRQGQ